ncbi:SDR family oxidoreductase [Streptomyces sp. NPDC090493]|uniref:SDR family oxidoreductase n=1 Tax=Streptomyces sp. NPDC090493 TaxID=3365964 RepID=UPI00381B9609
MRIQGAVALVTGGNRGLGEQFVAALLSRGAAKVYATARDPATVHTPEAVPIELDVTDLRAVRAAAERAPDVTLLVNNAGIAIYGDGVLDGDLANLRRQLDTNVLGPLQMARAFAPVLARGGGGAILNVLSRGSWIGNPESAGYYASKAAAWSITNSLRLALHGQGTLVTALHVGVVDTDMAARAEGRPKSDPAAVANLALDGVEAGAYEVIADDATRRIKALLSADPATIYPSMEFPKE